MISLLLKSEVVVPKEWLHQATWKIMEFTKVAKPEQPNATVNTLLVINLIITLMTIAVVYLFLLSSYFRFMNSSLFDFRMFFPFFLLNCTIKMKVLDLLFLSCHPNYFPTPNSIPF